MLAKSDAAAGWIRRRSLAIFASLVTLGSLRIVATYHVFNPTADEPAHIACGMQWLSNGVYRYEPQNPPLARVASALGPYLAGERIQGVYSDNAIGNAVAGGEGIAVLFKSGHYERNTALARLGILPFFWMAAAVVRIWARRYIGEPGAAFAVLLFTFLPPVLAHAGLATTDMPLTATLSASFLMALVWLERPGARNSVILGLMFGLALLSKFSALAFLPAALFAALIWYAASERPTVSDLTKKAGRLVLPLCLAAFVCFVVVWTGYRFSFGHVASTSLPLPAPELFAGLWHAIKHNRAGHPAYLLGRRSGSGWWYYYPVALAVKTPLPFLALSLYGVFAGVFAARRSDGETGGCRRGVGLSLAFSLGILTVALFIHINIGVRHILPLYAGLSIVAAAGAVRLLELSRSAPFAAWTLLALVGWMAATSGFSHPDYLAYFNALAGREPDRVLVDSDLDWGQDVKRLGQRLREVGATEVAFPQFFDADLKSLGFPPVRPLDPANPPPPGWSAVNLTLMRAMRFELWDAHPEIQLWPEQIKPTERIGKGIWLWYFPPSRH